MRAVAEPAPRPDARSAADDRRPGGVDLASNLMRAPRMTKHDSITAPSEITEHDIHRVAGGAALDFNAVRTQAQAYCPTTAARYAGVNPASVTRPVAQRMGNECLTEMGSFKAAFARGPMQHAIDQAFPPK
jgi:hypothetical protein